MLVTGTTGFKGSWLAFWLQQLGAKVIGVSLKPERDAILFNNLELKKRIKQYFLDIRNFKKLNYIVKKEKPDIIFHLAAQSIVSESFKNPLSTFQTNVLGSTNILECYRINNISKLVFITSDKCYLNLDKNKNYKETDILGGLDNYSSSKASAELIFSSYFNSYFKNKDYLSTVSARAGNVIGGGDMKINRIVPDIIKSLFNNESLILRNPKATRPWQHVLEPLSGYLLLGHKILHKKLNNRLLPSWNFGPETKNCKSVGEISRKVINSWGKINHRIKIDKKNLYHESKLLSLNIQKAKKELKWQPRLDLKDTVKFTVDWYKNYLNDQDMVKFTKEQIQEYLDN